jgi:hypothetical protein
VTTAFELGTRSGQPDARTWYVGQLTVIRRDQGRHAELIEPLREFADSFSHMPVWRIALAGLYCETDQLDEARAQLTSWQYATSQFHGIGRGRRPSSILPRYAVIWAIKIWLHSIIRSCCRLPIRAG